MYSILDYGGASLGTNGVVIHTHHANGFLSTHAQGSYGSIFRQEAAE